MRKNKLRPKISRFDANHPPKESIDQVYKFSVNSIDILDSMVNEYSEGTKAMNKGGLKPSEKKSAKHKKNSSQRKSIPNHSSRVNNEKYIAFKKHKGKDFKLSMFKVNFRDMCDEVLKFTDAEYIHMDSGEMEYRAGAAKL